MLTFLKSLKKLCVKQKIYHRKRFLNFKMTLCDLLMTFLVILYKMKKLPLYNVGFHRNLYQNRLLNEYAR